MNTSSSLFPLQRGPRLQGLCWPAFCLREPPCPCKSNSRERPHSHAYGMRVMPSDLLASSLQTPTGSSTDGTPLETRRIVSLAA